MRRRASSESSDPDKALERLHLNGHRLHNELQHKTSSETSFSGHGFAANGLNGLTSPLWGEPGRKLPSVSSMLQLPPLALPQVISPSSSLDIEDLGKDDKAREDLLIEELVHASPRLRVELTSTSDRLCPKCHNPDCPVSNPPLGYYSELDVAKHTSPGDCWIMANGYVYDCSRYITKHPGGSRTILSRAGQDASRDFEFHTRYGRNVWNRLQVGRVAKCRGQQSSDDQGDCSIC